MNEIKSILRILSENLDALRNDMKGLNEKNYI
jgi:hypothetical protein